jgi:hypothetical protein
MRSFTIARTAQGLRPLAAYTFLLFANRCQLVAFRRSDMQNFSGIGVLVALCVCRLSAAARHLLGAKISANSRAG